MRKILRFLLGVLLATRNDFDVPIAIVAGEGMGKSNLGLWLLHLFYMLQRKQPHIDFVALDTHKYAEALFKAPSGGAAMFDEAGEGLFSRESQKDSTRQLVKAFMVIRGKRLFNILILPNWFLLDVYFRKFRIKYLLVVRKRGEVWAYNQEQIREINKVAKEDFNIFQVRPEWTDRFPEYKGWLKKPYLAMKETKIEEALRELAGANETVVGALEDTPRQIIRELVRDGLPINETIRQFVRRTGKSRATFFRIAREMREKSII